MALCLMWVNASRSCISTTWTGIELVHNNIWPIEMTLKDQFFWPPLDPPLTPTHGPPGKNSKADRDGFGRRPWVVRGGRWWEEWGWPNSEGILHYYLDLFSFSYLYSLILGWDMHPFRNLETTTFAFFPFLTFVIFCNSKCPPAPNSFICIFSRFDICQKAHLFSSLTI